MGAFTLFEIFMVRHGLRRGASWNAMARYGNAMVLRDGTPWRSMAMPWHFMRSHELICAALQCHRSAMALSLRAMAFHGTRVFMACHEVHHGSAMVLYHSITTE